MSYNNLQPMGRYFIVKYIFYGYYTFIISKEGFYQNIEYLY